MFSAFFGEISGSIGDNGDFVGHSSVIVLRMKADSNEPVDKACVGHPIVRDLKDDTFTAV